MRVLLVSVLISLLYFFAGRYCAEGTSDSKWFNDLKDFVGDLNLKDNKLLTGLVGSLYHKLGGTSESGLSVVRLLILLMYFHNSGVAAVYGLLSLFVQGYQSVNQDQVSGQVDEESVDEEALVDEESAEVSDEEDSDEALVDEDSEEALNDVSDEELVDEELADEESVVLVDTDDLSDEDVLG